jgi:hypothetical protein
MRQEISTVKKNFNSCPAFPNMCRSVPAFLPCTAKPPCTATSGIGSARTFHTRHQK